VNAGSDHYYRVLVGRASATYDLAADLSTLSIDDEAGRPSRLEVVAPDPYRVLSHALREGMDVTVELGSSTDHELVFRGFVTRVESDFPEDGVPTIQLVAHDRRARLGLRERSRRIPNHRLSEVVREVARSCFAQIEVSVGGDPDFDINGVRQPGVSDLRFLLSLAEEFDCQVLLERRGDLDVLRFVSLEELYRQQPAITMHYGRAHVDHLLSSFRPVVDIAELRLPVARMAIGAQHADEPEIQQRIAEPPTVSDDTADEGFARLQAAAPERALRLLPLRAAAQEVEQTLARELGTVRLGEAPPFLTPQQAAERGNNRVARHLLGMRARGRSTGLPSLRASQIANIQDVGARFSGNWYLTNVRHVVDGSGYHTELECER
jgi:phage protein D